MHARTLVTALLVSSAALVGCSSDNTLGLRVGVAGSGNSADTLNNARIRFVNATATSLDVATGGIVSAGNGALGFGTASSCISANAASPNLAVRVAGTNTLVAGFTPTFQSGVSHTVIAYTGTGGATQFATVTNTVTPASGMGALRVFNAAAATTSYDVYVTAPGASLATASPGASAVPSGSASPFFEMSTSTTQQVRITAAGSKTVVLDLGNVAFMAGQNATLVIAPPVTGTTSPRAFLVVGC